MNLAHPITGRDQILDEFRTEVSKNFDGRVFDTMMDEESNLSKPHGNPVFEMRERKRFSLLIPGCIMSEELTKSIEMKISVFSIRLLTF